MTRSTYLMLHSMLENTCIFSIYHVWYVPNVLAVFCYLASTAKKLQSFEMNGVKLSACLQSIWPNCSPPELDLYLASVANRGSAKTVDWFSLTSLSSLHITNNHM